MTASNFSPMSAPVRSIFDRVFIQLDHAQHYYTAYLLGDGESEIGELSRPCASIARKRQMDRSDAKTWKVTFADEHATPIIDMDSRLTMKGTTNHMRRAIAEFIHARDLEKAAKARENKATFKKWFGACRRLAGETHITHARDIGSIDIGATRLVYSINNADAHGNEHADWRNGIRRAGSVPYRAEMIIDMAALRSVSGREYRRLLIQEMSQRRRAGMLATIPGKPNARAFTTAETRKGRDVAALASAGNSLFSAEALAELAAIEGVSVTIMTPDNVADVHNTIAAHVGEPSAAFYMADKLQEPSAAELRGMRLFNGQSNHAEPDWRGFTHLELAAVRDELKEEEGDGTNMISCHFEEAEIFSVYGMMTCGEYDLITDISDRDTVLAVIAELQDCSRLPFIVSNRFGMKG